jgi:toxin ParE1/3/4
MAARVREVVWAESARGALDEVITYIAQDSRSAAMDVLEAAIKAAASLATLSERGRAVPETNDPVIREIFVFRYRLMYRVEHERSSGVDPCQRTWRAVARARIPDRRDPEFRSRHQSD